MGDRVYRESLEEVHLRAIEEEVRQMRVKLWQSMECSVFEHPVVTVPAWCGVLVACGHDRWMG